MNFMVLFILITTFTSLLSGCAETNLRAPCPHFGATCHQVPVNSWDNR